MKTNYLTIKNLATGAFLLSLTNGLLFTWFALAKIETPIRDKDGDIAVVNKKVLLADTTPAPIPYKNIHLLFGLWAGVNYCFAFSLWNGKKLSIQDQKSGQDVYDLPADVARLLINRGYIAKPGPLLDYKNFADDCLETSQKLLVNTAHLGFSVIEDGFTLGADGVTVASKKLYAMTVPPEIKTFIESKLESNAGGWDAIKNTRDAHLKIVGVPRAGKTTLALDYIRSFYESYQGLCEVWIGDINYLKPDAEGFMNTWFEIDERRVMQSPEKIKGLFAELLKEIDTRKQMNLNLRNKKKSQGAIDANSMKDIKHLQKPILFVIDEWGSVAEALDKSKSGTTVNGQKETKSYIKEVIAPLIKQCLGFDIHLLFIDHSNATGCGELPQYLNDCLAKVIVTKNTVPIRELNYLVSGPEAQEVLESVRFLKENGADRVIVADTPGSTKTQVLSIPKLSQTSWEFPQTDDSQSWIELNKTTILDMIGEGKTLTNIFQGLIEVQSIPNKRQSLDNPFYKVLKEFYDTNRTVINLTKSSEV